MRKTIYVNCSFCDGLMEVDPDTGDVVQKWAAGERAASADDKLAKALNNIAQGKKKRASLFDVTKKELEGQKKKAETSFMQEVERLKKEGLGEKPKNPFDME